MASSSLVAFGGMTKKERTELGMRQVADLGLWALDNSIKNCRYKTPACEDCYNLKFSKMYKNVRRAFAPGGKDDQCWETATAKSFRGLSRVRLNTRGEPFPIIEQVKRVGHWVRNNPSTKFWIISRAWQTGTYGGLLINWDMLEAIEKYVMCYSNARVMASVDEWTAHHWEILADRGWKTMYYSKNNTPPPWLGSKKANVVKCRKTWKIYKNPKTRRPVHPKAVCKTCRTGCFSDDRVDVWLKYH